MEEKLSIWFDKDVDYLEITIGRPKKGYFEPIDDTDVFKRIDSKTGRVIGFAFLNFSKNFDLIHKELKLPVKLGI